VNEKEVKLKRILWPTLLAVALLVGTSADNRAVADANYAQGQLGFYGAQLDSQTVEVTAFEQGERSIEIRGHVTMGHDDWVKFSQALSAAGFPVKVGEPKPIATGIATGR
jgi:hypothetical protein